MQIVKCLDELLEIVGRFSGTYIVGAGVFGRILGEFFNTKHINWCGYVDIKEKGSLCNKKIISYDKLKDEKYDCLIVSSVALFHDIYSSLKNINAEEFKIVRFESNEVLLELYSEYNPCVDKGEDINKYRDFHRGKRCFIIGNGPSLKISDLEKLKDEITFASNAIYALYNHTTWRPTYYSAHDNATIKRIFTAKMPTLYGSCETFFTGITRYEFVKKQGYNTGLKFCYLNIITGIHEQDGYADFSSNADKFVYLAGTITYVLLQLAIYMGIKEIYLLGVDFSFSAERNSRGEIVRRNVINHNRLIESEEKELYDDIRCQTNGLNYVAEVDYQLWGYRAAKCYADAHGIKIYNATRGGNLEIFPRVAFDTLF